MNDVSQPLIEPLEAIANSDVFLYTKGNTIEVGQNTGIWFIKPEDGGYLSVQFHRDTSMSGRSPPPKYQLAFLMPCNFRGSDATIL